jgi:bromodomain-containing factor 1
LSHRKYLQAYWQYVINEHEKKKVVINEHEKENLTPIAVSHPRRMVNDSHPRRMINDNDSHPRRMTEISQNERLNKNIESNLPFCYNILNELINKSYATPFYKCSTKELKHPMDLFTINLKLENNKYTSAEEFEKDVRLMFHNCFTYNDVDEIYHLGKTLEFVFNNKWTKRPISQTKQKETLKRNNNMNDGGK